MHVVCWLKIGCKAKGLPSLDVMPISPVSEHDANAGPAVFDIGIWKYHRSRQACTSEECQMWPYPAVLCSRATHPMSPGRSSRGV